MSVTINRALNLVIPVELENGLTAYVHSTPVGREVFEANFMIMSKAFATLFGQGLGVIAGPRVAYLTLKKVAEETGEWSAVKASLVNEIVRLTNVAMPTEDKGFEHVPLHTLFERNTFDAEDRASIEGELIFFTLVARLNKRDQATALMKAVGGLWGSQITSLDFTAYLASLRTSIEPETFAPTPSTLSVPH